MHARYLVTIVGIAMLSGAASASDRLNGGFDRAANDAKVLSTQTAVTMSSIKALPKSGRVSLRGVVDKIDDDKEFVLSDSTGSINIQTADVVNIEKGQTVTIIGDVGSSWGKRTIEHAEITKSSSVKPQ
ncbi:MAG: NirD/YgiW/YdeI family stress tolerance protein [Rickettsiales bacterium]|nr:NirD/YgiW/YdeI family stress tolerance protein [Rickettsiales bacterium]